MDERAPVREPIMDMTVGAEAVKAQADRAAEWLVDRQVESMPLPGADQSHYSSEGQRQVALAAAEKANIARTAGELGLTSAQWSDMRKTLGRSPTRSDISRS